MPDASVATSQADRLEPARCAVGVYPAGWGDRGEIGGNGITGPNGPGPPSGGGPGPFACADLYRPVSSEYSSPVRTGNGRRFGARWQATPPDRPRSCDDRGRGSVEALRPDGRGGRVVVLGSAGSGDGFSW